MHGLKKVVVERFKNIENAPMNLSEINVIVGANNSGKSSILQAIHFAVGSVQSLELDGQLRGSGSKTSTIDPARLIYVPADDVHALGPGGRLWEDKDRAVSVSLILNSGDELAVSMRKGRNRNIQISVSDVSIAQKLSPIERPFTIFTPGLAGIAKSEQYVSDGVLLRAIARGDSNLVLRNTLLRLWNTKGTSEDWSGFIEDLSQLFPEHEITIEFDQSTDEEIRVLVDAGAGKIPLELCGTGVLQTIQILSYIHQFSPSVVVLDEPDSHLHPNNQRLLCRMLRTISKSQNIQVILCTHSRHMLDALRGSATFLWARDGSIDIAEDGTDLSILLDIGALDLKERIAAGQANCIILTEDERVNPIRTLCLSSGFNEDDTDFISYFGCTKPHNLRPLVKIIREINPKAVVVVHRDRDYELDTDIEMWKKKIRSLGAEPFVTKGVDSESHFLNPEHLAHINSDLTVEDAKSIIDEAISQTETTSIEKSINGRCDIAKKNGTFGQVNIGALTTEMNKKYHADRKRYAHGKTVLAKARALFQEKYHKNLAVFSTTPHIATPELVNIQKPS